MKRFTKPLLVFLAVAFIAAVSIRRSAVTTPAVITPGATAPGAPSSLYNTLNSAVADTAIHQTETERRTIEQAEAALRLLAQRSPSAKHLEDFYHEHAMKAHIRDDGKIVAAEPSRSPNWFAVGSVANGHKPKPGESFVDAMYNTADRVMVISPSTRSKVITGLLFAHELVHAEDGVLGGEAPSPAMSPAWLFGEFHAHAVTHMILNEYTKGAWNRVVESAELRRVGIKRKAGHPDDAYVFSFDNTDSVNVAKVLGPMTGDDLAGIIFQYNVDVNMVTVKRAAGQDTVAFMGRSQEMITNLYQQFLPKNLGIER